MFYYYTKWKFKYPEEDIGVGPFHSTWITESNPKDFLNQTITDNLYSFLFIIFETETEMEDYWEKANKPNFVN